ncbi:MAG: transcription elongation factor GreA [Candidatus Izemoplasmatales bacterium]
MENTFKLTEAGFQNLKDELETLKEVDRKENLEALKEARAQGDLSENADYDAARDEQARIEARIKEIENILKHSEIIRDTASRVVMIGKTVNVKFVGNNIEKEYTIVGHLEANPLNGKISNESPLGRALIGHKKGQSVTYKAETGKEISVEIIDIK